MRLFKYLSANGLQKTLENQSLLFSVPQVLNDPFESSIQSLFGYDRLAASNIMGQKFLQLLVSPTDLTQQSNGTEISKHFMLIKNLLSKLSEAEKNEFISEFLKEDPTDKEKLSRQVQSTLTEAQAHFSSDGVFCASSRPDNLLLWAHYAEDHFGAVIELKPDTDNGSVLSKAKKVVYTNDRPVAYYSIDDFINKALFEDPQATTNNFVESVSLTKSLDWINEEELRVIIPFFINIQSGETRKTNRFHSNELEAVYFGCRMGNDQKHASARLAKNINPRVKLIEMQKDPLKFNLVSTNFEANPSDRANELQSVQNSN